MFRMTVEDHFSAAHSLREYPGPCCRLHGHNYRVLVRLEGDELDTLGMLIDYTDVKRALAAVLHRYDHVHLNEMPEFQQNNPTSEVLAMTIYQQLTAALLTTDDLKRRIRLTEVVIYESDNQGVGYGEV